MLQMFEKEPMPVGRTYAGLCTNVVTDFILDKHSNFQFFLLSLDFFCYFFALRQKKNTKKPITNKLLQMINPINELR